MVLRGMGLGGWMVQEGYMLKTGGFAGSQSAYKEKVKELIDTENISDPETKANIEIKFLKKRIESEKIITSSILLCVEKIQLHGVNDQCLK